MVLTVEHNKEGELCGENINIEHSIPSPQSCLWSSPSLLPFLPSQQVLPSANLLTGAVFLILLIFFLSSTIQAGRTLTLLGHGNALGVAYCPPCRIYKLVSCVGFACSHLGRHSRVDRVDRVDCVALLFLISLACHVLDHHRDLLLRFICLASFPVVILILEEATLCPNFNLFGEQFLLLPKS